MKQLPTLFARTSTGAVQQWTIEIEEHKYRAVYGQVDGKLITGNWTECIATNVGRANERDTHVQAEAEAQALWKKKMDTGYWEDVADIDKERYVEPMLAKNYKDRLDDIIFPLYAQPKLDGARAIGLETQMQSRYGKPWVSVPHIHEILQMVWEKEPFTKPFDGELYCDRLKNDFDKIMSLIKKKKPTWVDLEESKETIQYWIYDIVDPSSPFSERHAELTRIYNEYLKDTGFFVLVPTVKVNNQKELDDLYESWVEQGMEGQMVRFDEVYEQKRSKYLLKRKEFQDAEYRILDIIEGDGNKAEMAGRMLMEKIDKTPFNDGEVTFKSNIKGNRAYLRELLENKHLYINQLGTVRYPNLTPAGKPRFPYVIKIRAEQDLPN